jgi:release factor glutamine methyltransferase
MAWGEEGERAGVGGCGEADGYSEMKLCTSWKCYKIKVHKCVYKPAEDSILALEALYKLYKRGFKYDRIVDLGTGTGILALAAYELFDPNMLLAVDISPYAVRNASCNLPLEAHVVQSDGLSFLNTIWDLVILNPPYLPLEPVGLGDTCSWWLELSWSGGGGVMERLVGDSMSKGGEVLLVYSTLSPVGVESIAGSARIEVLGSLRFFFEELKVLYLKPRF